MGRFLQVGTTEYFPSLKLQVWHLRDLLTWCVHLLFSSCFYQTLFDMLNGCCQQFPIRGKTPLLQIPSITSCHPSSVCSPPEYVLSKNVCVKTSLKEKLWMHKPTIWKKKKKKWNKKEKEVRGLRFWYLLKMGLDSGLTLHAIHWHFEKFIETCRPKALFSTFDVW